MGKQKIKNRKGSVLLTNKLGKFERLNQEETKILINGSVGGLAPVHIQLRRKTLMLHVDVSRWTPLSCYFANELDEDAIFSFLWSTVSIAYDCERYGLRIENLCWNPEQVFVDEEAAVRMVYWPVTTLEQNSSGPLQFYFNFCQYLDRSGADKAMVHQYGHYFYQRTQFDFHRFYYLIADLLAQWRRCCNVQKQEKQKRREEQKRYAQKSERLYRTTGIWLENTQKGEYHSISLPQTRIGRDEGQSDVVLKCYEGISRRHAVISSNGDGRFVIMDVGSANGTFVDGKRIKPYQQIPLVDGSRLSFGNISYVFRKTNLKETISIHQLYP